VVPSLAFTYKTGFFNDSTLYIKFWSPLSSLPGKCLFQAFGWGALNRQTDKLTIALDPYGVAHIFLLADTIELLLLIFSFKGAKFFYREALVTNISGNLGDCVGKGFTK
jgi:hypothetical protein